MILCQDALPGLRKWFCVYYQKKQIQKCAKEDVSHLLKQAKTFKWDKQSDGQANKKIFPMCRPAYPVNAFRANIKLSQSELLLRFKARALCLVGYNLYKSQIPGDLHVSMLSKQKCDNISCQRPVN